MKKNENMGGTELSNLKYCPGCKRDLPPSLYKRGMDRCLSCVIDGPGEKPDVIENKLESETVEARYVKHETDIIDYVKRSENGLSIKELNTLVDATKDNIYQVCQKLVKAGKLEITKEQRGAGKAQNIYTIPELAPNQEEVEVQKIADELQRSGSKFPELKVIPVYDRWGELKNRLIMDGDCGTALKIMVEMEKEETQL